MCVCVCVCVCVCTEKALSGVLLLRLENISDRNWKIPGACLRQDEVRTKECEALTEMFTPATARVTGKAKRMWGRTQEVSDEIHSLLYSNWLGPHINLNPFLNIPRWWLASVSSKDVVKKLWWNKLHSFTATVSEVIFAIHHLLLVPLILDFPHPQSRLQRVCCVCLMRWIRLSYLTDLSP